MVFVTAEKPEIAMADSDQIPLAQFTENSVQETELEEAKVFDDVEARDSVPVESIPSAVGWAISAGNDRTVYLASIELAFEVLENVKKNYLPDDEQTSVLDVEFVEPVEIWAEEIPLSDFSTAEEAFMSLTEGIDTLVTYIVQKGDNYWSIASKNGMTPEELKRINNAPNDNLQIGQVLQLNRPTPVLSVKTTVHSVRLVDIPYGTVYQNNSNAWEGQNRVITAGITGKKEVEYEIAQINGVSVEQIILSETVLSDPVDRIMERGTRVIAASRAVDLSNFEGGSLQWPVRGRITSPFGRRGSGHHNGIDIEAKTGDPVYSAGPGTVIAAGRYYDYGNRVIVDHGNGLTTWYAHLNEMSVSVGQTVGVLELLGTAGRTGRTTGPHLHFEVRVNNSGVNPVHYLN